MKAFNHKGRDGKLHARLTSDNKKTMPYRHALAQVALVEATKIGIVPLAVAGVPVGLDVTWHLRKPKSAKKNALPAKKPDSDKLLRSTNDALTGIIWHDDAQVVRVQAKKVYGEPERVEILAYTMEG